MLMSIRMRRPLGEHDQRHVAVADAKVRSLYGHLLRSRGTGVLGLTVLDSVEQINLVLAAIHNGSYEGA
jgi:hypothetical protein